MTFTIRAIGADELPVFVRTDAAGFGESTEWPRRPRTGSAPSSTGHAAAFDGDQMVGCSRNYTFELTVPGGAQVGCAGVSAVAVLPTHRRRGVLRSLMADAAR